MPTVDDLVISLRIDPTSELSNLKKQLDQLVGKEGTKTPEIAIDPKLKVDVDFIKGRLLTITQGVFGRSVQEVKQNALAILRQVRGPGMKVALKDSLATTEAKIDLVEFKLLEIANGIILNVDKANKFLTKVGLAISQIGISGSKERKVLIDSIVGEIKETQELRSKLGLILKKIGIPAVEEFKLFEFGKEFADKIDDLKEIFSTMEDLEGLTTKQKEELSKLFESSAIMEDLAKSFEILGIKGITPETFATGKQILEDPKLKTVLNLIVTKALEGKLELIPQGFKDAMKEFVIQSLKAQNKTNKEIREFTRGLFPQGFKYAIDIVILEAMDKAMKDAIKEFLPSIDQTVADNLREQLIGLPLKTIFTGATDLIREVNGRLDLLGPKGILGVGIQVNNEALEKIDKQIPLIAIDLIEGLKRQGLDKDLAEISQLTLQELQEQKDSFEMAKLKLIDLTKGFEELKPLKDLLKGLKPGEVLKLKEIETKVEEKVKEGTKYTMMSDEIKNHLERINMFATKMQIPFLETLYSEEMQNKWKDLTAPEIVGLLKEAIEQSAFVSTQLTDIKSDLLMEIGKFTSVVNSETRDQGGKVMKQLQLLMKHLTYTGKLAEEMNEPKTTSGG